MKRFIEPRYVDVTGYVPNGEVIKMMEQAGQIATRRYWIGNNNISYGTKFGILAGIDKLDFRQALLPEDYVHVKAIVNFVSQHSLEVKINVYAEDLSVHEQRLTNSATIWYVAAEVIEDSRVRIMQLPPLHYESSEDENEGYRRYQLQKDKRMTDYQLYLDYNTGRRLYEDWNPNIDHKDFPRHTVQSSQMSLDRFIQASDCSSLGFSDATSVIELMDTTAVMAASKHCDNPCKTLSIDSITFHHPIRIDSLLTTVAKISSTSEHTLHVKIAAIAEEFNTGQRQFVANASFNLISMDKNGNPLPVPPLLTFADLEQIRL